MRSPSTWWWSDIGPKDGYEAAGLRELWRVDTVADEIVVWRRSTPDVATFDETFTVGVGDELTTPVVLGFALDVAALFDR